MRLIGGAMIAGAAVFLFALSNDEQPNAEEMVQRPRAEVYAELDRLYSAVERKAATVDTVTGTPPVPVVFTFDRDPGRMLSLTAEAGMRTIRLQTWLEDGPAPNLTKVKVRFDPESLQKKSGAGGVLAAVQTILWRTEAQFVEGQRIKVLFGGPVARDHYEPSSRGSNPLDRADSAAPAVNPGAEAARTVREARAAANR